MLFGKILLPTDGSDASLRAGRYVAGMLKDNPEAQVTVFTVDPIAHQFTSYATIYSPDFEASINEMAKQRLESIAGMFDPKQKVETVHVKGEPGKMITQYAEENDFDLIVMGTTGAGNISGVLFGSVAYKVSGTSKVPVLLICKSC